MMKLYGYWRSTAAFRVRIALFYKGLDFESIAVHLVKDGGEQHSESYAALNPNELVPTLVDGDLKLHQSLAIIDYLEEKYPEKSLYPDSLADKATVKAMAMDIACEVHPLNNLRVQQYLSQTVAVKDSVKTNWVHHWMHQGFASLEKQLEKVSGQYCFGNQITVVDICLVAQIYNAERFNVDLSAYPLINKVVENCRKHSAFIAASPENQPDAVN